MAADPLDAGDHLRNLTVKGLPRTYRVHLPPQYDRQRAWPVVLAFHGGGTNAESMIAFCGLSEKADAVGFVAVYPEGTGRVAGAYTWNGGNCCGYAQRQQTDDVRYVRKLLDDLAKVINVDHRRVFATGMSNGAILCYLLASELSDRLAAIAPVAGPMGTDSCWPQQPVSVLHFHGTLDQFAPYAGGHGKRSLTQTEFFSVDHSIRCWVAANGCRDVPELTEIEDRHGDGTHITVQRYHGGEQGSEVILYQIHGGGHTWPGREPRLEVLGPYTSNVVANEVMWEFFERHGRGGIAD